MSQSSTPIVPVSSSLLKGILCIVGVTIFFASMEATVKVLSDDYNSFFIVWARYIGQAVGCLIVFAPILKRIVSTQSLWLQVFRSSLLFVATMFFFSSIAVMPLANVTAIAQVAPLIITAMAALILAEKVGIARWLAVFTGFVGAIIIIRPGLGGFGWTALLPLGGALAFAGFSISTRFLSDRESPWTTFFYTATVGAVAASAIVPFYWEVPKVEDLFLFAMVAGFGAIGQASLIFAMGFAAASLLAPFLYLQMVWAVAFGFFIFAEVPDVFVIVGSVVIIAAGIFVKIRERRAHIKETRSEGAKP